MSSITLEKATLFHSGQLCKIYNFNISKNRYFLDVEEKTLDNTVVFINKYLDDLSYPILVAKNSKNKVLGYGYLTRFSNNKIYKNTCEIHLLLGEDVLGLGILKSLGEELEIQAKLCGISKLIVNILEKDNDSLRLYKSLDYNICGKITDACYKRNKYFNLVMLEKNI